MYFMLDIFSIYFNNKPGEDDNLSSPVVLLLLGPEDGIPEACSATSRFVVATERLAVLL